MKTVNDLINYFQTFPKDMILVEGNTLSWNSKKIKPTDFDFTSLFRLLKPDEGWKIDGEIIKENCLMIEDVKKLDY